MKTIKPPQSKKRRIVITAAIVATIALATFLFLYAFDILGNNSDNDTRPVNTVDYSPATDEQIKAGEEIKQRAAEENPEQDTKPRTDGSEPDRTQSDFRTYITTATSDDLMVYIRNEITGIYNQGSCSLTLSKGGTTITKTSGVQPLPKSSTCQGFNIPVNEMSPGEWNIDLKVEINNQTVSAKGKVAV